MSARPYSRAQKRASERQVQVACVCSACGTAATCRGDQPAPTGWYFILPPGDDFRDGVPLVACSSKCRLKLKWRRQP